MHEQANGAATVKEQVTAKAHAPYAMVTRPDRQIKESSWLADYKSGYGRMSALEKFKVLRKLG